MKEEKYIPQISGNLKTENVGEDKLQRSIRHNAESLNDLLGIELGREHDKLNPISNRRLIELSKVALGFSILTSSFKGHER